MSDVMAVPDRDDDKHEKEYHIFVNTEKKLVESDVVTYEEAVRLAYPTPPAPNIIYTVTYEKAKHPEAGELVAGQSVIVKNGTEFDVTPTSKS